MDRRNATYRIVKVVLLLCLWQSAGWVAYGQDKPRAARKRFIEVADSLNRNPFDHTSDSLAILPAGIPADSIEHRQTKQLEQLATAPRIEEPALLPADSLRRVTRRSATWVPNPTKATWLALLIPGGGQIYNRKYWKLPIVYGGFAGCAYALTWNGKMYKDYSNAYRDAVNENWSSTNITDLLPAGYIDRVSKSQLTETLRKRKDTYRRYRDLSIFATIGVYLLSVVDAYVDAELSNFDLTPDLSMRVEPVVMPNQSMGAGYSKSVGMQCSFRF